MNKFSGVIFVAKCAQFTLTPFLNNNLACERPNPVAAPVTKATLPLSNIFQVLAYSSGESEVQKQLMKLFKY